MLVQDMAETAVPGFPGITQDSFAIEFWMRHENIEPPGNMVIIGRDNRDFTADAPDKMHWWIRIETSYN